jgi:hypothetical protein
VKTRQIDSAWQSCADEAQAAVLAELDEGMRGFHAVNPNRETEGWQASKKNWYNFYLFMVCWFFIVGICRFSNIYSLFGFL